MTMTSFEEYIKNKKAELKEREKALKEVCDDFTAKVREWLSGINDRDFTVKLQTEKINLDGFYDAEVTIPAVYFFQKAVLFMPERRAHRNKQNLVGGIYFQMLGETHSGIAIYKSSSYKDGTVWAYESKSGELYDLNQHSFEELLQKSF